MNSYNAKKISVDAVRAVDTGVENRIEQRVRERTAEYLAAAREADIANVSKSSFLANMSHEIRTPMNAILGYAQILAREAELSDTHRKNLDSIMLSARHLLSLVNSVLDISKIESGKMELIESVFDLTELFKTVEAVAQSRSQSDDVHYEQSLSDDLPRYVRCDESKVRQILVNLVSNALKFTESGTVSVTAFMSGANVLEVDVEDTGVGIAREDLDRVFVPFQQVHDPKEEYEGTGLGLAISKQCAQLMGGDIAAFSELGSGTRFRLSVPVNVESQQRYQAAQGSGVGIVTGIAGDSQRLKILVVDDNKDAGYLASELLTTIGFEVQTCCDGLDAVKVFQTWKPEVILMDRRMPNMDGLKATEIIKNCPGGDDTVVIMISASAFEEDIKQCMDSGADSFLQKPYFEDDLLREISRLKGVRYLYGEDKDFKRIGESVVNATSFTDIGEDDRENLRHALLIGDQDAAIAAIQAMSLDSAVQDELADMVMNFRYDDILKLIDGSSPMSEVDQDDASMEGQL